MPSADLKLPNAESVPLFFLRKWNNLGPMIYLQSVRSGRLSKDLLLPQEYKTMAPIYANHLVAAFGNTSTFDAVVSPPSGRDDAQVYRLALLTKFAARDLTKGFSRKNLTRAATACSLAEMVDEFEYKAEGGESELRSLLVVDEFVASGSTIASVLHHLRKAGLSKDCKITAAVAAWLRP